MPIKLRIFEMMAREGIHTRVKLAKLAGLPPWRVGEYVKGNVKRIDLETLEKLCKALHCQPGDLLEYQPDEPAPAE